MLAQLALKMHDTVLQSNYLFTDLDLLLFGSVVAGTGSAHIVQLEHVDVVVVLVLDHLGQVAVVEAFQVTGHGAPGCVAVQVDLHQLSALGGEVVECWSSSGVVAVYFRHDMNWF